MGQLLQPAPSPSSEVETQRQHARNMIQRIKSLTAALVVVLLLSSWRASSYLGLMRSLMLEIDCLSRLYAEVTSDSPVCKDTGHTPALKLPKPYQFGRT